MLYIQLQAIHNQNTNGEIHVPLPAPPVLSKSGAFGVRLYAFPAVISFVHLIRSSASSCVSHIISFLVPFLVPPSDFVRLVVSARPTASRAARMAMPRRRAAGG